MQRGYVNMKKLLVMCLLLLMYLTCTEAYAEKEGLYTYQVNPDNTATITKFDWANNRGDIYIPEILGGHMVTAIGERAFAVKDNNTIENKNQKTDSKAVKITLPDSILSIGEQAFRGVAITYVNIPLNTIEIGGGAFAQCIVSRFNIANGHQVFATIDNALYNKQTKTLIAWPENKAISDEIPYGIVNIGDYAFYQRKIWVSASAYTAAMITLPDTVQYIGRYSFSQLYCHIMASRGLRVIDEYAFYKSTVEFYDQLSVRLIAAHAFEDAEVHFSYNRNSNYGYYSLISDTPYQIGDYAFYNCRMRNDGYVLKNVTSVGEFAFSTRDCKGIVFVDNDDLNQLSLLGASAFCNAEIQKTGKNWIKKACIYLNNSNLTRIPANAFNSTGITDVVLGDSIISIDEKAFYACQDLESIQLPFVGDKRHNSDDTCQYTFGYIFGSVSYIGATGAT